MHDVNMAEGGGGERKPMAESGNIRPGKAMVDPVEIGEMGKVGLALCYDLRSVVCTSTVLRIQLIGNIGLLRCTYRRGV